MDIITAVNVEKSFGQSAAHVDAVRGIDLSIAEGEMDRSRNKCPMLDGAAKVAKTFGIGAETLGEFRYDSNRSND